MNTRGSGLLLHITSLPSPHGIGDMGPEAYRFADFLAEAKQKYWQILPLNPINRENGFSPYFNSSAFAGNPLLISMDILLDEELLRPDDLKTRAVFNQHITDYNQAREYKMPVLDKAYERFKEKGRNKRFMAFCAEQADWLDDFALFAAIKEEHGVRIWNQWPNKLRDRWEPTLDQARRYFAKSIEKEKFFQYIFFKQWFALKAYCNKKGIDVIGDIPIYVSYDSADVWVDPHIFKLDEHKRPYAVSGVPPDYFSTTGQLWNNPVYRWDVLKETDYAWWVKRLRHTFERFDIVRIDHFRGLVQYWEVPAGEETAMNGKWEDVPTYDFFDTLMNRLGKFPVIVEDLGFITQDVIEARRHYAFPGMRVLQFAFGEDNPDHPYLPRNYTENCVAYTGTHDNNTIVGWFTGEATEDVKRRVLTFLGIDRPHAEINWELIDRLMGSVAGKVIFPVQDILGLGEEARMNQPRETFGNWRWRLLPGELTTEHAERLRELTVSSERST